MLNISTLDDKFVKANFETMELYFSYCLDHHLYSKELSEEVEAKIDLRPYTSKGINGVTTAIILCVDGYVDDGLILTILAEGSHRIVFLDDASVQQLVFMQKMLRNNSNWTDEKIDYLQFIVDKPFIITAKEGVMSLIKPLDTKYYENNQVIEMLQTLDLAEDFA